VADRKRASMSGRDGRYPGIARSPPLDPGGGGRSVDAQGRRGDRCGYGMPRWPSRRRPGIGAGVRGPRGDRARGTTVALFANGDSVCPIELSFDRGVTDALAPQVEMPAPSELDLSARAGAAAGMEGDADRRSLLLGLTPPPGLSRCATASSTTCSVTRT
jgi:hypothetical protein